MPWMAEQQTTNNLRRLAGRKTSLPGGPHLPTGSSGDKPPVLFRLPEVAVTPAPITSPSSLPHSLPAPHIVSSVSQELANPNYNAINHVAGAVTGTVASGIAAAGAMGKSAITAGAASVSSLATEVSSLKNYSTAASSLSQDFDTAQIAKTERAAANKPLADSMDAESRSWWEHWSSGIILMLLILALVTAGIIAIRDPERTRNTDRSIADQIKDVKMPDRAEKDDSGISPPSLISSDKPTLADTMPQTKSPASPTLLPEATGNNADSVTKDPRGKPNNSTDPSTLAKPTVAADMPTAQASLGSPQPRLASDSKTFVSSSVASSSGPASASPSVPFPAAKTGQGSSTVPTMTASTPLKSSSNSSSNKIPAENPSTPSGNENQQGPNLTWPVQEEGTTDSKGQMESSQTTQKEQKQFVLNSPQIPATATTAATASSQTPVASNSAVANTAPANDASHVIAASPNAANHVAQNSVTRPAVLETALPNEDLESILALRRQALAQARVTNNQYYPGNMQTVSGTPSLPQTALQPSAISPSAISPSTTLPSTTLPSTTLPSTTLPSTTNNPSAAYPAPAPATNHSTPNYSAPNNLPATNSANGFVQPSYSAPTAAMPNAGYAPTGNSAGSTAEGLAPPGQNASQPAATRSWTYQPNQAPQTNSWTLPTSPAPTQPTNSVGVNGGLAGNPNNYYQAAPANVQPYNNANAQQVPATNSGAMVNGYYQPNPLPQGNPATFQQPGYAAPGYQTGTMPNTARYQIANPYSAAPATNGQPAAMQQGNSMPAQPTVRQTLTSLLGPSPNIVAPQNRVSNTANPMIQQGNVPNNSTQPNVLYPNASNQNQFPSNFAPSPNGPSNYPLPNQGRP